MNDPVVPVNKIEVNTCRICNNAEGNTLYVAREMMFGMKDEFAYFECAKCGCLQIKELPEDMSKYYPVNYYSFNEYDGRKFKGVVGVFNRMKYSALVLGSATIKKIAKAFTGINDFYIFEGLGVNKNTRILDVGCGNGKSFLYPLAETGFKNVMGCDPHLKNPIRYLNGLQIENSKIEEVGGTWDVITYHHSFEHIDNPLGNLQKVFELLAPDGVCVIRIPTVSSFAWEHYRTNWVQLDAPRHIFLHAKKSINIVADLTGLELYKTVYDSNYFQFAGSENYMRDIPLNAPRHKGVVNLVKRKMEKNRYTRRADRLNAEGRGDQAAFFLRRKRD